MSVHKSTFRALASNAFREDVHRVRRLRPAKYLKYERLRRTQARRLYPQANAPFTLGAGTSIVLHESTVPGVRSHWIESGQGIRELRAFVREAPGHSVMLDIGAAAGIFSAAFCALTSGAVLAFEPSPIMLRRLSALIELNPGFDIEVFDTALGSEAGTQIVRVADQFSAARDAGAATGTMTVQRLDEWVAEYGVRPDFAKIDVEGMELDVLRGGAETFRRSVRTLMLEVHVPMLPAGDSAADLQALLTDLGFALFTLEAAPIVHLAEFIATEREMIPGVTNIVCRKRGTR